MKRLMAMSAALALVACATTSAGGPRPPQGPGPGGTDFGFWDRDAEGSVDVEFRSHITAAYDVGDEARARATLEKDGFTCTDGKPAEGKPGPAMRCERLYRIDDDVHAWTVEFWPGDREPRARYSRVHIRDPFKNYDAKKK